MKRASLFLVILVMAVSVGLLAVIANRSTDRVSAAPLAPSAVDAGVGAPSVPLSPAPLSIPESSRWEASAPQTTAPVSELGLDLSTLAVPNVVVIDGNTDRPMAHLTCVLTDGNGVTLIAQTDTSGRLATDELLLTGEVALSIRTGSSGIASLKRAQEELALFELEGIARFGSGVRPAQPIGKFQHRGKPTEPDRWTACDKRWVPLEVAGSGVRGRDVHLALPFKYANLSWDASSRKAASLPHKGVDESVMKISDDAFPLVFEAQFSTSVSGTGTAAVPFQWARQRFDKPVPGRVLRAVQFLPSGVICATADANVVPHLHEWPLRLVFGPFQERDRATIREQYGSDLGSRIIARLGLQESDGRFIDRALGTVTSESGAFRGRVLVSTSRVGNSPHMSSLGGDATASVLWREAPSGEWVGSFELRDLVDARYSVELSTDIAQVIAPRRVEFSPATDREVGTFVIRDQLEYGPVVLRVRRPSGGPSNSCFAQFISDHRARLATLGGFFPPLPPRTSGSADEAQGHTLTDRFPRKEEFRVTVQTNGYEPFELTHENFHWDGQRLVCDRVLQVKAE